MTALRGCLFGGMLEGDLPLELVIFFKQTLLNYQFSITNSAHFSVGKMINWVGNLGNGQV